MCIDSFLCDLQKKKVAGHAKQFEWSKNLKFIIVLCLDTIPSFWGKKLFFSLKTNMKLLV